MQKKILAIIIAILIVLGVGLLIIIEKGGEDIRKEDVVTDINIDITEERKKEVEDKIADLKKKLAEDPKVVSYWLDLALYEKSFGGDLLRVESVYKEALEYFPDNSVITANLGDLYKQMGDYNLSEKYYKKALKIESGKYYIYNDLAELYLYKLKNSEKAEEIYLEGLEKTDNHEDLLKVYAYFLEEEGRIADSVKYWEMLLEKEPANKEVIKGHIDELKKGL